MDIITKSFFDDFITDYDITEDHEGALFEHFVNYCIVSKFYTQDTIEKYQLDFIQVGSAGDLGIDGLAIIMNGKLISSIEEASDLLDANGYLDVIFVFVQTKTSSRFCIADMGSFFNGIKLLFREICESVSLPSTNKDIDRCRELIKYIFENSSKFKDNINPKLYSYYAAAGVYTKSPDYKSFFEQTKKDLLSYGLFSTVICDAVDKNGLIQLYKKTKGKETAEIVVEQRLNMPDMEGVKESYLILLSFKEFRKIIIDSSDSLKSVFNDNVRAFQGDNLVNRSIDETLKKRKFDLFTAMNNGITLISKQLSSSGKKMNLTDYQIVNGCQTSHVLYNNRNLDGIDGVLIPMKIICSDNKGVRNQIILGANSQTEVKREQLIALSEFQENIEDYYNAIKNSERLYYERRSKQYKGDIKVPQYKVITIPIQIMAFTSMILEEPHNVRGYYAKIVDNLEKGKKFIFSPTNNLALYYLSGLAYYRMECLFNKNIIDRKFKKCKFHLLLAFRLICEETPKPKDLSDKSLEQYCSHLILVLNDFNRYKRGFQKATESILKILPKGSLEDKSVNSILTKNIFKILDK